MALKTVIRSIPKVRSETRKASGKEAPLSLVESVSAVEMPKRYRRNADEMTRSASAQSLYVKKQMPKTKC